MTFPLGRPDCASPAGCSGLTIIFDARCLQDLDYRHRGVGQHARSLIAGARRSLETLPVRLVGLIDPKMLDLEASDADLFDETSAAPYPDPRWRWIWFVQLSPMTHDSTWVGRILHDKNVLRICVFYDLIPLDMPERYLRNAGSRIDYLIALSVLNQYDLFGAISQYSAANLMHYVQVCAKSLFVSGVAVRPSLRPAEGEHLPDAAARHHLLVVGGGDARKNPECVIRAHAQSAEFRRKSIPLIILGGYPLELQQTLRKLHSDFGGDPRLLELKPHLKDEEIRRLYREALAVVVPSRAEGFSMPVVEGSAGGAPVLASDATAHRDLITNDSQRFHPDDPDDLRVKLERLVLDRNWWLQVQREQSHLWRAYTAEAVADCFWSAAKSKSHTQEVNPATPKHFSIGHRAKPQVAVLTPLPPALSGVADFSAAFLKGFAEVSDVHVFTATAGARNEPHFSSLQGTSAEAYISPRFDRVISIIGNSEHHLEIFHLLLEFGGACVAHDARMINFYMGVLGTERSLGVATKELQRDVSFDELGRWLADQQQLKTLFMSEICAAARPLILHSSITSDLIRENYNCEPITLPFAQYNARSLSSVTEAARSRARSRLGIPSNRILVTSFGILSEDKAPEECIWAVSLLRKWGYDVEMVFCGKAQGPALSFVGMLARDLGIAEYVKMFEEPVSSEMYADFLLASD